jgi:hypothetical protein
MGSQTSPVETIAYAWGYGTPSLPLFRDGAATEAAHRVATAHGWDSTRQGAWASEMRLPARRDTALLALSAEAQRDPAVEDFTVP